MRLEKSRSCSSGEFFQLARHGNHLQRPPIYHAHALATVRLTQLVCAVCNSAGTQVAVNAAGQAATTKTPPPPPAAPKSNVTGTTPVSLISCPDT